MALGRDIVQAILREHSYQPIRGAVVLIGHQTINISRGELLELLREHGIDDASAGRTITEMQIGDETSGEADRDVSASAFFQFLGADAVRAIKYRWEDPNIIHDLGNTVPAQFMDSADFVVDGGALSDTFSPAMVLRKYATLLRPGGRLFLINNLSGHFDPYSIPSGSWYLDYFVANGFVDCKVYVMVYFPDRPPNAFYLDSDCLLDSRRDVRNFLSEHEMAVIVFAEKGQASTVHERPTHAHQRSPAEWTRYRENLRQIERSPRPHLVRSRGALGDIDIRGGHRFMRADYAAIALADAHAVPSAADDRPRSEEREGTDLNTPVESALDRAGNESQAIIDSADAVLNSIDQQLKVLNRNIERLIQMMEALQNDQTASYSLGLFE
jgi:SAM-dependent methyltransferase